MGALEKNQGGPPVYAPPAGAPPPNHQSVSRPPHSNAVIEAATVRARDEQQMINMLQSAQMAAGIYNQEIEPEHETEYVCGCLSCQYRRAKLNRMGVHDQWSKAVKYPGEKTYTDTSYSGLTTWRNPYVSRVVSPYGNTFTRGTSMSGWIQKPVPSYHTQFIHQTIALNNKLNKEAQAAVDAMEPADLWGEDTKVVDKKEAQAAEEAASKTKRFSSFKKSLGIGTSDATKGARKEDELRNAILLEEAGRWPNSEWKAIVSDYQVKVGMSHKVAELRKRSPIQYLHLLRAGYFEPIPVQWASQNSNPLKFSIESAGGWRGITPSWRGYEDTAEERLYYILNHRDGSHGTVRLKPDFISEMDMARARMESAVEPPPEYFSSDDTCHVQHKSDGYSKQVMPREFQPFDRPETPTDDTMILLDVSGSMDFDPLRPMYNQYLIQGYAKSTQPKNKDVAKAIIRRFTDAMANHDHTQAGYDLVTFASAATYLGSVNHSTLDHVWSRVKIGGGTRVMTGWQKVKELHFNKHSESATHHPVYGWQAGPQTPMLRLLLLLDGEATDMDEFELDLLGLNWAHVTIFLIGVDGCPHHHRHANELQRISDVNHHVSFIDAQGNTPERFVTHELLKRHLGYNISMSEFEQMEQLPEYHPI